MWIGVLWAGLRVAMWITHVGGKYRHGLLEKSLIISKEKRFTRDFWRFGSVNAEIASDCDGAIFRDGKTTRKIKFSLLKGGGPWGQRGKSSKNACFRGKRHDNRILKVQIIYCREIWLSFRRLLDFGALRTPSTSTILRCTRCSSLPSQHLRRKLMSMSLQTSAPSSSTRKRSSWLTFSRG